MGSLQAVVLLAALALCVSAFPFPTELWTFTECADTHVFHARFGTRSPVIPARPGDTLAQTLFNTGQCSFNKLGFCKPNDNNPACDTSLERVLNKMTGGTEFGVIRAGMYQGDAKGLSVRLVRRNGQETKFPACSRPFEKVFGLETVRESKDSNGRPIILWHTFVSCLEEGRTKHFTALRLKNNPKPTDPSFLGMPTNRLLKQIKGCNPSYPGCGAFDTHAYQRSVGNFSSHVFDDLTIQARKCTPGSSEFTLMTRRQDRPSTFERQCTKSNELVAFTLDTRPF